MLLTKSVRVKWYKNNKKYYENKGYVFTKYEDEFDVKISDLNKSNGALIEVKCDCPDCKNPYLKPMRWSSYNKYLKEDGKYYCGKCAIKLYGNENYRKSRLKNSISFQQWCYDNLSKTEADEILSRWDYEKNVDKNGGVIKPDEVGYGSTGFYGKGYWFKCNKHSKHKSELKNINNLKKGQYGSILCKQCNSFAQWGIDNLGEDFLEKYWSEMNIVDPWELSCGSNLIKVVIKCQEKTYHKSYIISPSKFKDGNRCPYCVTFHGKVHPKDSLGQLLEDKGLLHLWSEKNEKSPYEYTKKSSQYIWLKCTNGIHEDHKSRIADANFCEFRCPSCQFSKGEKRIEEYLIKNKIKTEKQKEFKGLLGLKGGNLSYDFYLSKYNVLIEYQGEFHDGNTRNQTTKQIEKQKEHDRRKKEYAEKNKIKLLEIWYYEYDEIEKILDKELNNRKLKKS